MERERVMRVEPVKGDENAYQVVFAAERVSRIRTIQRVEDAETGEVLSEKVDVREDTVTGFGETLKIIGPLPRKDGQPDEEAIKTALRNHPEYSATITLLRAKVKAWKPPEQTQGPEEIPVDKGILS